MVALRYDFDVVALQVLSLHSPDNSPFLQDHSDLSSVFGSDNLSPFKSQLLTSEGETLPAYEHGIGADFSVIEFHHEDQVSALNASWAQVDSAFSARANSFNVTHDSVFTNILSQGPLVADLNTTYDVFIERSHSTERAYNPLGRRISHNSIRLRKWEKQGLFVLHREKNQSIPSAIFSDLHAQLVDAERLTVDRLDGQDSLDATLDLLNEVKIPSEGAHLSRKVTFTADLAVTNGHINVTSGLLSGHNLSLAFGHEDTGLLESEFQFDSPLHAKYLELPSLNIDPTFVLTNDTNVIEIDVHLDEIEVDNLDINSSMIGTFDLAENYLTTDDHVQEGLAFYSSGVVTFSDSLNASQLNGHEPAFFTGSFFNVSSLDEPFPELIYSDVTLEGDFVPGGLINNLSIPDDLMMVNDERPVTSLKWFDNVTVLSSLNVTDEVDGLNFPDGVVTLTGDEQIESELQFTSGLDTNIVNSSSSLLVTGYLNGTNMTQLREEFIRVVKEVNLTKEALSGNIYRDVVVSGDVTVLGTINNVLLEQMALDILSNSTIDTTKPLVLTGSKTVLQLRAFQCDMENIINGVNFSNLALTNDSDVFHSHLQLENVTQFNYLRSDDPNDSLFNVSGVLSHRLVDESVGQGLDVTVDELHFKDTDLDGLINGVNSSEIVLAIDKPEWQDLGSKEFVNSLSFQSVHVTGGLNFTGKLDGLPAGDLTRRVVLDLPQTLQYESELIDSTLASLSPEVINSVPTQQFLSNIFTKSSDQSLSAQHAFHGQVNNFAPVTTHRGLFPGAIGANNVNYFSRALEFAELQVEGNVTTEGGKVKNFRPNDFLLREGRANQVVTSALTLQSDVKMNNLTVNRLFGPRDQIFHPSNGFNILLTNQDQVIDGQIQLHSATFQGNVTSTTSDTMITEEEVAKLLNSIVSDAIFCNDSASQREADLYVLVSNATFERDVHLSKFYGRSWSQLINSLVVRNSRNTQTLPHKVRFENGSVSVHAELFAEKAAVRKKLNKLNAKSVASLSTGEVNAPVTFSDDVFISECNIESSVNELHLSPFLSSIDRRNSPDPPQSINVTSLHLESNVDVNTLNKKPIRGSLVPLDQEVTLFGDISFTRGSHTSTSSLNLTGHKVLAYTNIEMLLSPNKLSYIEQNLDLTDLLASNFPRAAFLLQQLSMDTFAIDYRVHEDQVYLLIEFKSSDSCTYWRCFRFDPHRQDFLESTEAQANLFGTLPRHCHEGPHRLLTVSGPQTHGHVIHNESIVKPLLDEGINNLAILPSPQVNLMRHIVLGSSYYTRSFLFDVPNDSWILLQDFSFSCDKIVALTYRQTGGFIGFRNAHGLSRVFLFFYQHDSREWTEHQVIEMDAPLLDMQVISFDKQLFLFTLHASSLSLFHLDHEANLKQVLKSNLPNCVEMRKLVVFDWQGSLYAIITGTKTRLVKVHGHAQLGCY